MEQRKNFRAGYQQTNIPSQNPEIAFRIPSRGQLSIVNYPLTTYCPRMLKAGIVGLPNVGKSTLFNAVTRSQKAQAANYPFCTIDPNVGIVTVPDERLDVLSKLSHSTKVIPTAIEFVDIAGLVEGASQGAGLGNQFLSHIREVDAIIQVVRCFENDDIIHELGSVDPLRDIEIINAELVLCDLSDLDQIKQLGDVFASPVFQFPYFLNSTLDSSQKTNERERVSRAKIEAHSNCSNCFCQVSVN